MNSVNTTMYPKSEDYSFHNDCGPGLRLRWNAREQFSVENLFKFECKTADEVLQHFKAG